MRIIAQGLVPDTAASSPRQVVHRMLATQGQLTSAVPHSLIVRTTDSSRSDVLRAFEDGHLVRFWPFRGTLHIVATEDHHWLRTLWATRGGTWFESRAAELGVGDHHVGRATHIATERLQDGPVKRAELRSLWIDDGLGLDLPDSQQATLIYLLFVYLHQRGTLVAGPIRGNEHLLVGVSDVADEPTGWAARIAAGDEGAIRTAYAEVARRYALSHGPITPADLARWTGASMGLCRRALEDAATGNHPLPAGSTKGSDLLEDVAVARYHFDGGSPILCSKADRSHEDFYMRADLPQLLEANRKQAMKTMFLASFDELHVGYKDRSCLTDTAGETLICPGRNGMFRPFVLDRGRLVAVHPRTGLVWAKDPSKRVQRDTARAMKDVSARLAR